MSYPTEVELAREFDDLVDQVFGDIIDDQALERSERGGALSALRLRPVAPGPTQAVLESADLDIRTCVHELAYALATILGDDVAVDGVQPGVMEQARRIRDLIRAYPKCQLKGAS